MFVARFAVKHIPIKLTMQEYYKRIQAERLRLEAMLKNVNQVAFKKL